VKALALILARAGSKGVPRKNAAIVGDKPCIEWSILAAQAAVRVGPVAVSTDDAELTAIAERCGAIAIWRPPELATDTAPVDDAARHAVKHLTDEGVIDDEPALPIVILYANVPVRPDRLIDRALALMEEGAEGCDSVQSYAPVGKHHPWWTARLDESGAVKPWEGEVLNHGVYRRQDLPPAYIPDGGVLAVTRAALFGLPGIPPGPHAFLGHHRRGITTAEGEVVDIDSPVDLLVADAILKQKRPEIRSQQSPEHER
jgi:CMP-N,N'-diacetyllegionaminic acid synthase